MKLKRMLSFLIAVLTLAALLSSCGTEPVNEETTGQTTATTTEATTTEAPKVYVTLYVDANAAPGGDGSEASPFASITEAQAKIRELKADESFFANGITVSIKDGEYVLKEGLKFTAEDSGTEECPITYVSENGGAVLSGGVILPASDFEPISEDEKAKLLDETAREKVVKVDLTKYGVDPETVETVGTNAMELFIDGERSMLARYPNEDFIRTDKVIDVGDTHEEFSITTFDVRGVASLVPGFVSYEVNNRGGTFTVNRLIKERIQKWSSLEDIYAHGYFKWSWSDSTTLIGNFDFAESSITLSKSITYGVSSGAPFYFLNVYDELDHPGEFFIDKSTGILYVYKTDDFDSSEIMLSRLTSDIISATELSHVTFRDISLCATRGNGMSLSGNDILIDNCRIYNVRGGAVSASGSSIKIQNCEFSNLGAFGVSISGGDSTTLTSSENLVYNNYIHNFGVIKRTYQSAVSVSGCGVTVSHNEVCDSPHQAMNWSGPNHVFEYNEIYDVCLETSDCGAFYSGRNFTSYGSVIRYNFIHDIGKAGAGAHAIYWDDGLSGQTAYGNLISNISGNAFAIGGGRDNVVENNMIINAMHAISYDERTRDAMLDPNAWFTHNDEMSAVIPIHQNKHWNEAFPIYRQLIPYIDGYAGDLDDPLLCPNPANNVIKNNMTYYFYAGAKSHSIYDYTIEHGEVENNPSVRIRLDDIEAWTNGDRSLLSDPRTAEKCPDFKTLPFEEMGRVK